MLFKFIAAFGFVVIMTNYWRERLGTEKDTIHICMTFVKMAF